LYSIGATSAKYFGQNNEKAPAAAPNKNLPSAKSLKFEERQIIDPPSTRMFVSKMHFHLPMDKSGPPNKAARADPKIVIT